MKPPTKPQVSDEAMAMLHATSVGIWDKEADRFWVRSNLMFLANGALLSVAGALQQPLPIRIITVAVGLFLAWSWLLINNKGGYYVSRWRPVIEDIEQHMSRRDSFPVTPLRTVRPDPEVFLDYDLKDVWSIALGRTTPRMDAGEIMHMVIVGFILAWLGLGAYYLTIEISSGTGPTPVTEERRSPAVREALQAPPLPRPPAADPIIPRSNQPETSNTSAQEIAK